jgi:glucans biosynthesis protein
LENIARQKARGPFVPQNGADNPFIRDMPEQTWREIAHNPAFWLWRGTGSRFQVALHHQGFIYDQSVAINVVEDGYARPISFNAGQFNYPEADLRGQAATGHLGLAGFSLYYPRVNPSQYEETVIFLGANHFQARSRLSDFGQSARALILNPALPKGEEFPYFREFWLIRPEANEERAVVHALLESPSLVGAITFIIEPGSSTSVEVKAKFFLRENSKWPEKIGLAPLSGMYLFSEKENGSPYDWRPELHTTDGLIYSDGSPNWSLRALNNPGRLMINSFPLESGGSYGLIQRDNNFDHYQDIGRRYDRKTWIFMEPLENFPPGKLELIEIPSSREIHDNIISYWLVAGQSLGAAQNFTARYRLYFMPPASNPHTLGRVVSARLLSRTSREFVEFYLDFESSVLNSITEVEALASIVESAGDIPVLQRSLFKNPLTGGWRLRLRLKPPKEPSLMDSILGSGPANQEGLGRVFIRLVRGENLPLPITETFVYDFPTP